MGGQISAGAVFARTSPDAARPTPVGGVARHAEQQGCRSSKAVESFDTDDFREKAVSHGEKEVPNE